VIDFINELLDVVDFETNNENNENNIDDNSKSVQNMNK
jgi:hypothetical protein